MTLSVEVEKLETRHATFYRHTLINYNVFLSNSIVKRVIDSVKYLKLQLVTSYGTFKFTDSISVKVISKFRNNPLEIP